MTRGGSTRLLVGRRVPDPLPTHTFDHVAWDHPVREVAGWLTCMAPRTATPLIMPKEHTTAAGRLAVPHHPKLIEQVASCERHSDDVTECGARLGIQIDPQLVRFINRTRIICSPHRPWMKSDGAHLGAPGQHRRFGRADFPSGSSRREGDLHTFDVIRRRSDHALLIEAAVVCASSQVHPGMHTVGPSLQSRWALQQYA